MTVGARPGPPPSRKEALGQDLREYIRVQGGSITFRLATAKAKQLGLDRFVSRGHSYAKLFQELGLRTSDQIVALPRP